MITTGIIVGKYFDEDKVTMYKVSVSIFKSNLSDGIVDATCCATPGQYEAYNQGDKVYVSFVNNKLFCPVILGKIYSNIEEIDEYKTSSFFVGNTLKVTNEANLPFNTKIGDIDFSNLKGMYLDLKNVSSSIESVNSRITDIATGITSIESQLGDKASKYDMKSLLTPVLVDYVKSSGNCFSFNVGDDHNGMYIFTFGNTMTVLPLYGLQKGATYKTSGTFVYDTDGSVVTTTINYGLDSTFGRFLTIRSGNSKFDIVNNYTGFLYKIKLY